MSGIYQKLESICGSKNVSNNMLDLIVYNSDLASLPPSIMKLYDIKQGEYVVRPETTSQIMEILKFANKNDISVTPRAGASAGLGGALAVNGGIILDMTAFDKIIDYDSNSHIVTVEPGVTWTKLIKYLRTFKRKIGIHPSSSPSATVGGFISTGGYAGIGAPEYGPISAQIHDLEVLLPSGELLNLKPPLSSLFVGAEGTLGIATKISLNTYPLRGISALAFGFKNMRSAIQAINNMQKKGIQPFHLMIVNKYFVDQTRKLGQSIPNHDVLVFMAIEGSLSHLRIKNEAIFKIFSIGTPLSSEFASDEWDRRYNAELFVKRGGPSLILLEIGFSLSDVPRFVSECNELAEEKGHEVGFVGILGHGNSMLCMPFILTDEREGMKYLKTLSFSREIISLGLETGGSIYGVGLHNSPFLKFTYPSETLKLFEELKKELDQNNILNPGKFFDSKVPDQLTPKPKRRE